MSDSTTKKEVKMITYYIETTEGMYRVNIPDTWRVSMDHTRNGAAIASITDENGSDRMFYMGVQNMRDSSTQIQELTITTTEGSEEAQHIWTSREVDEPLSRYTDDAVRTNATRRRNRARRAAQLREDVFIDDDYEAEF